jgi:hypothetical protein
MKGIVGQVQPAFNMHRAGVIISLVKAAAWSCLLVDVFVLFGMPNKGVPVTHGV